MHLNTLNYVEFLFLTTVDLFEQTLQVDTFGFPEINFRHRPGVLVESDLLRAVLAQDLVHLVGPLDDDALDGVLQPDVALLP